MYIIRGVYFLYTLLAIIFSTSFLLAQTPLDSDSTEVEQIDTVRVKKKIVVHKTVYAPILKKENILFVGFNAGVFSDKSYYKACENCQTYYSKVQGTLSYALSYNYGLNIAYTRNKLYGSIGIAGSNYRKKFHFVDSLGTSYNAINKLSTVELNALIGYWFRKNRSGFSYMLLAGASYASLYNISGLTLSQQDSEKVIALKDQFQYYPTQLSLNGAVRILYPLGSKTKLYADIFYAYDVKTIIKTSAFVQQRNIYGLKLGLLYTLQ